MAENARTSRKRPFSDLHGHFRGNASGSPTVDLLTSVYVVYLDRIALVGTTIGMRFAAAEIASGFGALFADRAMQLGNPQRTMLRGTVFSILLIAATPLLGSLFGLLLLF